MNVVMSQLGKSRWKPYLVLAFGALAVSWAAVLIRVAAAPALVTGAYRLTLASLILTPLALWRNHDELLHLGWRDARLLVGAGFFLGTSVNDTSQVTATALIYDQLWAHKTANGLTGADIAITTKLVRNTCMIAVIPFLGFWFARKNAKQSSGQKMKIMKYSPLFVFGYIAMGIVRSLGDGIFGVGKDTNWYTCWDFVKTAATYVIAVSVAGIGLNTDIRKLAKLGYKPFICGLIAALSVGAVSWFLVSQFGNHLRF